MRLNSPRASDPPALPPIRRTSVLAIVSFAFSFASPVLGPLGFVPGIVCGHLARSHCRKDRFIANADMALAGLIVGYAYLTLFSLSVSVLLLLLGLTGVGVTLLAVTGLAVWCFLAAKIPGPAKYVAVGVVMTTLFLAMFFCWVFQAREQARQTFCTDRLREIYVGSMGHDQWYRNRPEPDNAGETESRPENLSPVSGAPE